MRKPERADEMSEPREQISEKYAEMGRKTSFLRHEPCYY
jgi:hypothetical protein